MGYDVNETWDWLGAAAGWVFLLGMVMAAASAVPALARRRPRLMFEGFLVAISSLLLVLLAWGLPRLPL